MEKGEGFNFCIGPLVFKGTLDAEGRIVFGQRDLGPFGTNLDDMKGQKFENVKAQMIHDGYQRVIGYAEDYRQHAAKHGVTIDP